MPRDKGREPVSPLDQSPADVLASFMVKFAHNVDSGSAMKVLDMCGPGFVIRMGGEDGDIEGFRRFLEMRQAATYETRHIVGYPALETASDIAISGRVPMTAFRMVEGEFSIGVADFTVSLTRQGQQWLIDRWEMQPFLLRKITSEPMM